MSAQSTFASIFVVAGVGSTTGVGAASARVFAKAGYGIAIIGLAQHAAILKALAEEINSTGGKAGAFPVSSYTFNSLSLAFSTLRHFFNMQRPTHTSVLRAALFSVAASNSQPFLTINPKQVQESLDVNLVAAFAYVREVMYMFRENDEDEIKGTLIFAGGQASLGGGTGTSVFSAGEAGVRALSQSLSEEFEKDVHIVHSLINSATPTNRQLKAVTFEQAHDVDIEPEFIATSYLHIVGQERSTWKGDLDLRTRHAKL